LGPGQACMSNVPLALSFNVLLLQPLQDGQAHSAQPPPFSL
jgi:hypothetical protein